MTIMINLLILLGLALSATGVIIIVNPRWLFGWMEKHREKFALHVVAVLVRAVLGILLLLCADQSRFPTVILFLGWLSLFAAGVLAAIGLDRFIRLISWALGFARPLGRISGILVLLFGAFLVYAFI